MSWHLSQMVGFDTETSGIDVERDRIVSACVAVVDGSGHRQPQVRTWLINPGVDIPAEATKVHGITTEHARQHGQDPATAVKEIATTLGEAASAGVPIVAYNAVYDITILDRELRRHGVGSIGGEGLYVIDPLVLDKGLDRYRKGKRTLEAACEHYNARIDGAHDASHDALAAARVAWRIGQRYPQVAGMSLDELHAWQIQAKREQDESFAKYLRKQGNAAKTADEQIALRDRAAAITGAWPLIPYVRQEAIA